MALKAQSLFLYGLTVTPLNSSLDFQSVAFGPIRMATLTVGSYTLSGLMTMISAAMTAADPGNVYTITANRTISGGTENRVNILSPTGFLSLLFLSGPRNATSCDSLIGFPHVDQLGSDNYTGTATAGTSLLSTLVGYSYLPPDLFRQVFGSLTVSASGVKEALVWSVQQFLQVQFQHEPEAKTLSEWQPLMTWSIQQQPFEFTPEVNVPTVFFQVTLETTASDGKGLGFRMEEMIPDFPFYYKTGMLKFRKIPGT